MIDALEAADLSIRVGRDWFPVMRDDPPEGATPRELVFAAARALRGVGLGRRLQWRAVPGLLEAGNLDGEAGRWPRGIDGDPWGVQVMADGSVVVFAERGAGDDPERVVIGARLVASSPGPVSIVEVIRALEPNRRAVAVGPGRLDHALVRLVIAQEVICEHPIASRIPAAPREVVRVGRAVGVAWELPEQPAPFVVWTAATWVTANLVVPDAGALLAAAACSMGVRGTIRDRRDGDPPPLDYAALLDPGERVDACAIITS